MNYFALSRLSILNRTHLILNKLYTVAKNSLTTQHSTIHTQHKHNVLHQYKSPQSTTQFNMANMSNNKIFPLLQLPREVRDMILEHLVVSPKPLEPTKLRFHPADLMAYDPSLEVAWNPSAQRKLNPDDLTKFKIEEHHNLDLAILRVNKQLHAEATELLTKKNTVAIRITEGNVNILGHMIARHVKPHRSTLKDCSRFRKFQLQIQHQINFHRILGEDQSLLNVGTNIHQISKLKRIVANKSIEVFLGGHEGPDSKHVKRIQFHCRRLLKAKLTWNKEEEILDAASTTQDARMIEWECRYWATRQKRRWIDSRWFDGVRDTLEGDKKEQAVWDMALAVNARDEKRWIDAWGRHVATQKVQTWRLG